MYCFHSVDGFSKVGSYKGTGNVDGSFIYCGFKPAYILMKRTAGSGGWQLHDSARSPYNVSSIRLVPSEAGVDSDSSSNYMDILSNGFKHRTTNDQQNGAEAYLYIAFAETPFKNANAR